MPSLAANPYLRDYRRVFITGARGFVGERFASRLRLTLPAAEIFIGLRNQEFATPEFECLPFDLADPLSISNAIQISRPDLIIHLAAQSSVGSSVGAATETWNANFCGSYSLAQAVSAHAPTATFLYTSSVEVYGGAFKSGPVNESTAPAPLSAYSRSKLGGEYVLSDLLPPTCKLIIARPSNHSGAGQDQRFVLPSFALQIAEGNDFISVGNLDAARDFLHVEDVVDAYISLILNAEKIESGEVFNISSQNQVTIKFLLDRLISLSGKRPRIQTDPLRMRPSDIPTTIVESHKIRALSDWSPSRTLDDMLVELLAHAQATLELARPNGSH